MAKRVATKITPNTFIIQAHNTGKRCLPHCNPKFKDIIQKVEKSSGIPCHQLEKDYWATLSLWTLQTSGFEIQLKGGASLAKAFNLLPRSSEDLDISISNIRSTRNTAYDKILKPFRLYETIEIEEKKEWFETLTEILSVNMPKIDVKLAKEGDLYFSDSYQNGTIMVSYNSLFPSLYGAEEKNSCFPKVLLDVNSSRYCVKPNLIKNNTISKHILHKKEFKCYLEMYSDENYFLWPRARVFCIHPMINIVQKIYDCLLHRYKRELTHTDAEELEGGNVSFDARTVRHLEDVALSICSIKRGELDGKLPSDISEHKGKWPFKSATELSDVNLLVKTLIDYSVLRIKKNPGVISNDTSLNYPFISVDTDELDEMKWARYVKCYEDRKCFTWGKRLTIEECSSILTSWLREHHL